MEDTEIVKELGKLRKLGAMWTRKARVSGEEYFSAEIEVLDRDIRLVVFANKKKESEKHPDWIIYCEKN